MHKLVHARQPQDPSVAVPTCPRGVVLHITPPVALASISVKCCHHIKTIPATSIRVTSPRPLRNKRQLDDGVQLS